MTFNHCLIEKISNLFITGNSGINLDILLINFIVGRLKNRSRKKKKIKNSLKIHQMFIDRWYPLYMHHLLFFFNSLNSKCF